MKIYVAKKGHILCVAVILLLSAVMAVFGPYKSAPVQGSVGKNLPIYSVETPEKAVSITFDSAWGNEDIDDIINILKQYGCPATFFVVGDFVQKYPESVKKLYDAGHEIANHSDSHAHYSRLSAEQMKKDMDKCDEKIKAVTGTASPLFRPPYGEYNDTVVEVCRETGRYCIQWDVDSLDWKGLSSEEMKNRILPKIQNGSIILFHTGTDNTASALPDILEAIKEKGFVFKKTRDLIYKENYRIDHQGRQNTKS